MLHFIHSILQQQQQVGKPRTNNHFQHSQKYTKVVATQLDDMNNKRRVKQPKASAKKIDPVVGKQDRSLPRAKKIRQKCMCMCASVALMFTNANETQKAILYTICKCRQPVVKMSLRHLFFAWLFWSNCIDYNIPCMQVMYICYHQTHLIYGL